MKLILSEHSVVNVIQRSGKAVEARTYKRRSDKPTMQSPGMKDGLGTVMSYG